MKTLILVWALFQGAVMLFGQEPAELRDIDGNVYDTRTIGKQVWMVENLKTTRLNNGERIPVVTDGMVWQTTSDPACCWYENDPSAGDGYGALYNWYAVSSGRLCPAGWHVPSHEEWSDLTSFLGGTGIPGTQILMEGELKSTRTSPMDHPRWEKPNTGAVNSSGFSALPAGSRNFAGFYLGLGRHGFWWTSSAANYPSNYAWYRGMRHDNSDVFMTNGNMNNGYSVRCVKDQ